MKKLLLIMLGLIVIGSSQVFAVTHGILGDKHPTYQVPSWCIDSNWMLVPGVDNVWDIGTSSLRINDINMGGVFNLGTSASKLTLVASTPVLNVYTTSAATTGALTSVYISYTHTGDTTGGGTIFPLDVLVTTDTRSGGVVGAGRFKVDFNDTGYPHGVATVLTTEAELPNTSLTRGAIYPFEMRLNAQTSSSWGSAGPVAFMRIRSTGAGVAGINSNAYFMIFNGHTAGADKLVSLTSQTVKCSFSGETPTTTVRYLLFSQMQDGLGLGNSTTSMSLTSATTKAIDVYTTTSVVGDIDMNSVYIEYVRTASVTADGRDWGLKVKMDSGAYRYYTMTGIYSTCNIGAGGTLGRASAVQGELVMYDGSTSSGAYSAIDAEITYATNSRALPGPISFMSMIASGTTTNFEDFGYLFEITAGAAGVGNLISANSQTARVLVGAYGAGLTRYLVMSQTEDQLALTLTAQTVATNLISGAITLTDTWASGEVNAVYGLVTVTQTGAGSSYNTAAGHFELSLNGAPGLGLGLTTALMAKLDSDDVAPNCGMIIEMYPHGTADWSDVPFISFADYAADTGDQTNILFEIGNAPMGATCSTAEDVTTVLLRTGGHAANNIVLKAGFRIKANGAYYYVPLIAEGEWVND
jgi:hypothetical protein